MNNKRLIEAGALRQYISNSGDGPYIAAWDLEITNRVVAHLEAQLLAAQPAEGSAQVAKTAEQVAQLGIGFANNDQGVHVSVMQSHADGSFTLLHQAKVPTGDSFTRVDLATPAAVVRAPADLYKAALLAVERMRGCSATYIEDHAKDTYPGHVGCRPQDVAMMWGKEIHGIDAKTFLDEAIADLGIAAEGATPAGDALAEEAAKLAPILRNMCEGGAVDVEEVDIYADGYMAGDGDTYVIRAAQLLEQVARIDGDKQGAQGDA